MNFRLATIEDLSSIKIIYKEIIKRMDENQIQIWDNIYPCDFLENDIKNNRLYIMLENAEIVSAFALCDSATGEDTMKWKDNFSKALYIDRLGVNVNYLRKGIGSLTLTKAKEIAKTLGAEYLRLFVVDINIPAIQLYSKTGFMRVNGIYNEVIDKECILHEYGYEINLYQNSI